MKDLYDMNYATRQKVKAWAKENGWPTGSPQALVAIYTGLVVRHKLSMIAQEIDETVDRIMLLNDRIRMAIEEGNLVALVLLKERKDEEKAKLAALKRLLERESPMKPKPKEGEITDDMIAKAKDHPMEYLLPEPLKRGRCKCPVHSGKNEMSFSVKNNQGKCWSCHWEGDSIQLLMDLTGKSFPDAVRYLSR